MLQSATTRKQREELAARTGLSAERILKFANMADLYRIPGVGSEYAELLEAAGVDTVPELAQRNAANLATALAQANDARNLSRRTPSEAEVTKWVEQAGGLPRVITY